MPPWTWLPSSPVGLKPTDERRRGLRADSYSSDVGFPAFDVQKLRARQTAVAKKAAAKKQAVKKSAARAMRHPQLAPPSQCERATRATAPHRSRIFPCAQAHAWTCPPVESRALG